MAATSDLLTTYGFYVQSLSEIKKDQWQIVYYAIASQAGLWAASTKGFGLIPIIFFMISIAAVSVFFVYKLEDTLDKYRNKQQQVINTAKESGSLDSVFAILDEKKPEKCGYWFQVLVIILIFSCLVFTTLAISTGCK